MPKCILPGNSAVEGEHLAAGHDQFKRVDFVCIPHGGGPQLVCDPSPPKCIFSCSLHLPLPRVSKVVILGLVCSLYMSRLERQFFKFDCVSEDISLLDAIAIDERVNGSGWFTSVLIYWI